MTVKRKKKGGATEASPLGFSRDAVFMHADDEMKRMLQLAKHGDKEAGERLHWMLHNRMEHGALTDWDWDLLMEMHRRIASGEDARSATFTMPPSNRRTTAFRDRELFIRIFMWIETQTVLRGMAVSMTEACEAISPIFGVSPKTAKNIYLRVRKEYADTA